MGKFFVKYALHSFSEKKEDLESIKEKLLNLLPANTVYLSVEEIQEFEYKDFKIIKLYFENSNVEEDSEAVLYFKHLRNGEDKNVITKIDFVSKEERERALNEFINGIKNKTIGEDD